VLVQPACTSLHAAGGGVTVAPLGSVTGTLILLHHAHKVLSCNR
jgi:hypothetical protein